MAWANIVYGFAGLRSDADVLRFAPQLPDRWKKLSFSIAYRGNIIHICMEAGKTSFRLTKGEPVQLKIYDKIHTLGTDELIIPRP